MAVYCELELLSIFYWTKVKIGVFKWLDGVEFFC